MSYVVNKRTNRRIKIGSPTYKRALANGDVSPQARKFRSRSRSTSRSRSRSRSVSKSRSRSRSPKTLPREVAGTCKTGTHFYKQNQVGKRSPISRDKVKTPSRTKRCSSKKLSKSTTRVTRRSRTPVKRTRSPKRTLTRSKSPKRTLSRAKTLKRSKSPVKRVKTQRRKSLNRAKSVQKTLEDLMNLPEPGVIIEDGNMVPIEEEFSPTIPMEEMAMAGSSRRQSLKKTKSLADIPAVAPGNMIPEVSEQCPQTGTQGNVMQVGEGWIFVFADAEGNAKSLFIKQTKDKKLEVYAKDSAYSQSWFSLSTIRFRKPDFTCNKFIDFIDDAKQRAVLVEKKEAMKYPEIKYPEPPKGWGWKVWLFGALTSAILLYAGYNDSANLVNLYQTSGLSADLFYSYCSSVVATLLLPARLASFLLSSISQMLSNPSNTAPDIPSNISSNITASVGQGPRLVEELEPAQIDLMNYGNQNPYTPVPQGAYLRGTDANALVAPNYDAYRNAAIQSDFARGRPLSLAERAELIGGRPVVSDELNRLIMS